MAKKLAARLSSLHTKQNARRSSKVSTATGPMIARLVARDAADREKVLDYINQTIAQLEGASDRESLALICGAGIFCAEDPSALNEAVERLYDSEPFRKQQEAAANALLATDLSGLQRDLIYQVRDLPAEEEAAAIDAAYFLGVAVGRRLGPMALRPGSARADAGRPRKAGAR